MTPSASRVLAALRVDPMTVAELAAVLNISKSTARHAADDLRASGDVRVIPSIRGRRMGRPETRLAA